MASKRRGRARWIALGLIMGLVVAWSGVGLAGATTSSIKTCTKVSSNKTKVIDASAVAKCTAKGKGVARTWDDDTVVGPLQAKATAACNAADAETDYLLVHELTTLQAIVAYLDNHPSAKNAQSALCSAAPSTIRTCTKLSTNKTKVIDVPAIAKCIAKGKGVARVWDDHAVAGSLAGRVTTACNETHTELLDFFNNDLPTLNVIVDYLNNHDSARNALLNLCTIAVFDGIGG
jgi:hypothetical protein